MTVKIIDRDKGWNKIAAMLKRTAVSAPHVKVGVLGPAATEANAESGLTTVEVATYNEFGYGVPERSFIRETFDMHRDDYQKVLNNVADGILANKFSLKVGLEAVGQKVQSDFQGRIETRSPPFKENAPSTIARKGSSVPLINYGQLKNSITYVTGDV